MPVTHNGSTRAIVHAVDAVVGIVGAGILGNSFDDLRLRLRCKKASNFRGMILRRLEI